MSYRCFSFNHGKTIADKTNFLFICRRLCMYKEVCAEIPCSEIWVNEVS